MRIFRFKHYKIRLHASTNVQAVQNEECPNPQQNNLDGGIPLEASNFAINLLHCSHDIFRCLVYLVGSEIIWKVLSMPLAIIVRTTSSIDSPYKPTLTAFSSRVCML